MTHLRRLPGLEGFHALPLSGYAVEQLQRGRAALLGHGRHLPGPRLPAGRGKRCSVARTGCGRGGRGRGEPTAAAGFPSLHLVLSQKRGGEL